MSKDLGRRATDAVDERRSSGKLNKTTVNVRPTATLRVTTRVDPYLKPVKALLNVGPTDVIALTVRSTVSEQADGRPDRRNVPCRGVRGFPSRR
jgi:hypothetical protein